MNQTSTNRNIEKFFPSIVPKALDEFTEPTKNRPSVPNHIVETKIYNQVGGNDIVQVTPSILNFSGFQPNKVYKKVIKLCNVSADLHVVHIIPPDSKNFSISYKKSGRFIPGVVIDITVKFKPDAWRYFYDCVRIHCKGEENLIIPINAFPIVDISKFPTKLNFTSPNNHLGHVVSKNLFIYSRCPISFEFEIAVLQSHPAFTVSPLVGSIPANGKVSIKVDYFPTEYSTAHMKMQLITSQFAASPKVCEVVGVCTPDSSQIPSIKTLIHSLEDGFETPSLLNPRKLDPLQIAKKKQTQLKQSKKSSSDVVLQKNGFVVPNNVDTQHGVNLVLNQTKGKLKIKDMNKLSYHKNSSTRKTDDELNNARQLKQAAFLKFLQNNVEKERTNSLKWQVQLGDNPMTELEILALYKSREKDLNVYETLIKNLPQKNKELARIENSLGATKTWRYADDELEAKPNFDLYLNSPWSQKHQALFRFRQAVNTVLVRQEADRKLKQFRSYINSFKSNGSIDSEIQNRKSENINKVNYQPLSVKENVQKVFEQYFIEENVQCTSNDIYTDAMVSDNSSALVQNKLMLETDVSTWHTSKENFKFFELSVPKYYENALYQEQDVDENFQNYIPPKLCRKLRSGADEELLLVHKPILTTKKVKEDVEDVFRTDTKASFNSFDLHPPKAIMENPSYHPLHIFNRSPGTTLWNLPLPLCETDQDFYVVPEPKNRIMSNSNKFLDHFDVIKGLASWKKFPSPGLKSLSNFPVLSDVWVARKLSPFSKESLPLDLPEMLKKQPEEDIFADDLQDSEDLITISPQVISANFVCESQIKAENNESAQQDSTELAKQFLPNKMQLPESNIAIKDTGLVSKDERLNDLEKFLQTKTLEIIATASDQSQIDVNETN